jgi:hypothetical protein
MKYLIIVLALFIMAMAAFSPEGVDWRLPAVLGWGSVVFAEVYVQLRERYHLGRASQIMCYLLAHCRTREQVTDMLLYLHHSKPKEEHVAHVMKYVDAYREEYEKELGKLKKGEM